MKQPRILIDKEEGQEYVNFYFDYCQAQGVYVIDADTMGVVIGGADFILEYNAELLQLIKNNISINNSFNKN